MNVSVNVLCYRSKILSNGEHPLMVCAVKDGKRKYSSIGVSVNPQFWDFKKNKPKRNCPNRESIEKIIFEQIAKFNQSVLEYKAESKAFTVSSLLDKVNQQVNLTQLSLSNYNTPALT